MTHTVTAEADYSRDAIRTLLPFDAIPAIRNPQFVAAHEAKLGDNAPVIGVSFNGEPARLLDLSAERTRNRQRCRRRD